MEFGAHSSISSIPKKSVGVSVKSMAYEDIVFFDHTSHGSVVFSPKHCGAERRASAFASPSVTLTA
jgi:hypothetical protein